MCLGMCHKQAGNSEQQTQRAATVFILIAAVLLHTSSCNVLADLFCCKINSQDYKKNNNFASLKVQPKSNVRIMTFMLLLTCLCLLL